MKEKLYIQEFICNLVLLNTLSYKISMHNLYTNFVKILDICKLFSKDLVNEQGNIPRPGVVPRFSDLEIVSLSIVSEAMGIDSECLLFAKLKEYVKEMPNLISRRQYNDRRKLTSNLCDTIRKRMALEIDGTEGTTSVLTPSQSRCADYPAPSVVRWAKMNTEQPLHMVTVHRKAHTTMVISCTLSVD